MIAKIENRKQLIENAETPLLRKARQIALQTLEHALSAANPKNLLKAKVRLDNSNLHAGIHSFNLKKFRKIYVVGGGKAGGAMAEAIEEVLGSSITDGIVNVPYGGKSKTHIIKLHGASHPIPDRAGMAGTQRMMEIAGQAGKDDLIICLISGGGSSLMPLPRGQISLADKKKLTGALLKSGATINELNAVRKHISAVKGGWLAKNAYPATILNLVLSDVVGDPLESIASGPTCADSSTFSLAKKVLEKYDLWKSAPGSIRRTLLTGAKGLIMETPRKGDIAFERVFSVLLGNSRSAAEAACQYLRSEGMNTLLLTSMLEGESRQMGMLMSSVINEIVVSGNPVAIPAGIVASGETTVRVTGKGVGGRNQELVLSAALKIDKTQSVVVASMSTDGVDGPTTAAGAIIDGKTLVRADRLCMDASVYLDNNDSHTFFSKTGDLILTGPTGTNVNDISLIVVL